eukprot:NODE_457_length_8231_cov_0.314068.p2 type:complete len:353 gc:universal NODE_457_length_8231_cov_0.314068:3455-2397(-)
MSSFCTTCPIKLCVTPRIQMILLYFISVIFGATQRPPGPNNKLRMADPILIERLKRYLDYSAMSYCLSNLNSSSCTVCNSPRIKKTSKIMIFKSNYYQTDSYIAVNELHQEVVVTFRGMKNTDQSHKFIDARLSRMHLPSISKYGIWSHDIKVHSGFLSILEDSYSLIYGPLINIAKENPGYRVVFNGHSLGGAISVLLLVKLVFYGLLDPKRTAIVNFGSPRIGNKSFALFVSKIVTESWRVTHGYDIVPKCPPRFLGYHHFPNEIWIVDKIEDSKLSGFVSHEIKPTIDTPLEKIVTETFVCDLFDDARCSISTGFKPVIDSYLHLVYWNLIATSAKFGRCFNVDTNLAV